MSEACEHLLALVGEEDISSFNVDGKYHSVGH